MIEYTCSQCKVSLETDDKLGGMSETCPSCGTANKVPLSKAQAKAQKAKQAEANLETLTVQQRPPARKPLPAARPIQRRSPNIGTPQYAALKIAAGAICLLGWVCIVLGSVVGIVIMVRGSSETSSIEPLIVGFGVLVGAIVYGIFMIASGELMHCFRDSAINTAQIYRHLKTTQHSSVL